MSKWDKLLERVLSGAADANIGFADLCNLLRRLDFVERISGSHHIYDRPELSVPLNLQPAGKNAKPYQVKQVREALQDIGFRRSHDTSA